jgi:ABC-type lipoprotein release transport system permease subunit
MGMAMGLVLGIACLQDGMFSMMADVMIRQSAGHVQVAHPDWPSRQLLYDTVPESTVQAVQKIPNVEGAAARLFTYGLAVSEQKPTEETSVADATSATTDEEDTKTSNSVGARYVGVDPTSDRAIRDFGQNIVAGQWLTQAGQGEVVVGVGMARELEVDLGGEIMFLGQAADGSTANELLTVTGIFSTGLNQMDRSGAYMHLSDMQELLVLEGQVHQVLVVGADFEDAGTLAAATREALGVSESDGAGAAADGGGSAGIAVWSWQESDPTTAQMMGMRDVGLYIMLFIVFSVAGLSVLNTMLMTVFERTRELGVLRALGMSRLAMMMLVVLESLMLALVATGLGLLLGGLFDFLLIEYGFPYETAEGKGLSWQGVTFPPVIHGQFEFRPFWITVAFLNSVAVLAALWPALRVARLKPVEAMSQH